MAQWQQFIKDYLSFTKKERIGVFCIVIIFLLVYLLPFLFPAEPPSLSIDQTIIGHIDSASNKTISTSTIDLEDVPDQFETSLKPALEGELFVFNPNTLSLEGWGRLGLNARVVKTINNYRIKGGKFYKNEDLQKIWGLPDGFYERVKNHINILGREKFYSDKATVYPTAKKANLSFEINSADTTAFIALPGIGSKLASRIINFRDKLGGFYSSEQIGETYGLPDSTFQKIKSYLDLDHTLVNKININTATKDNLKKHPYIKWNLANTIVEYRNQHGPYENVEAIKNIANLDDQVYEKLKFYLVVE